MINAYVVTDLQGHFWYDAYRTELAQLNQLSFQYYKMTNLSRWEHIAYKDPLVNIDIKELLNEFEQHMRNY